MKNTFYFHPIYLRFLGATLVPITAVFIVLFFFSSFSALTLFFFYLLSVCFSLSTSWIFAKQVINLSKGLSKLILAISPDSPLHEKDFLDSKFSFRWFKEYFQNLESDLQTERERIEALLVTAQEALIHIERSGHLRFVNEPFWKIFTLAEQPPTYYRGKPYWEFFRDANLNQLIEQDWKSDERDEELEISIQGKFFKFKRFYLPTQNTLLLSLSNITQIRELDSRKRDLVANVSHELNTPLTSMMGYLETLQDKETDPLKQKYLGIISRNTKRLAYIVKDLLQLSKLERGVDQLQLEHFSLIDFVQNLIPFYEDLCQKKELRFETHFHSSEAWVRADTFQLEQMLINLIENAVRYTDKGTISLSITSDEFWVNLEIADTGIGIPSEHLERLFERFFVVDPARSKKSGGTGLGLSIVKHIVKLHGAKIEVKSQVGQGSIFTVRLKKEIHS